MAAFGVLLGVLMGLTPSPAPPGWTRVPIDGAAIEAVAISGPPEAPRLAAVGLSGLWRSEDLGASWRRDPRLHPQAAGCAAMSLEPHRAALLFRCALPSAETFCRLIPESGPARPCAPALRDRLPLPGSAEGLRREARAARGVAEKLGVPAAPRGPRLHVARRARLVLVGHSTLPIWLSRDGGRRFLFCSKGIDGLVAGKLAGAEGTGIEVQLAAASVPWRIHEALDRVFVGAVRCTPGAAGWSCTPPDPRARVRPRAPRPMPASLRAEIELPLPARCAVFDVLERDGKPLAVASDCGLFARAGPAR